MKDIINRSGVSAILIMDWTVLAGWFLVTGVLDNHIAFAMTCE